MVHTLKKAIKAVYLIFKLIIGLILVFIYHLPRVIIALLELSYAYVFNNKTNLTANPKEHLKRANKLLRKKQNSLLLYAALELRFALERIVHFQLLLANGSNKMLKEYDPVKKRKNISFLDSEADFPHNIFYRNKQTGERFLWGVYKPLNEEKVSSIKGRLGDLLHPKDGISLGVSDDVWYIDTRKFLIEAIEFLGNHLKNNEQYFTFKNIKDFEIEKINDISNSVK